MMENVESLMKRLDLEDNFHYKNPSERTYIPGPGADGSEHRFTISTVSQGSCISVIRFYNASGQQVPVPTGWTMVDDAGETVKPFGNPGAFFIVWRITYTLRDADGVSVWRLESRPQKVTKHALFAKTKADCYGPFW